MASRELSILVTAKNLASRALGQVKGDINSLDGAAKRAGSNMGRNIGIGVAAVGAGIAVQVRAGVESLVELERVSNLTEAALKSTGNAANQSVAGIRARSEALETMSGVDDKVLQNAQNLLLTFPQISEKAFEPTLESAVNLNAALGGGDEGLQGVLLQVAKAVNDPIKGMTALRRSGVSFTQAQIDQVKSMVAANDLMGAQAIVLGELETQFGGAAAAANKMGAGRSQKRFADAIEDMQMALATGFLPLIEKASGMMQGLVADPAFLAGVEDFGKAMAGGLEAGLDFARSVDWGAVGSALHTAGTGARMAMDAFLSAPPWLQTAILTGWGLNKLTGGGLGSIVGALGSGLIKGVLGMNAGVVNAKAGVVNVAGPVAGGPGGIGGAAGGLRGAINGGGLVGGLATGVAVAAPVLAGIAAVEVVNFQNMRTEAMGGLQSTLDRMPRATGAEIDASIARIEAQISQDRPLLDGILFNTNVRPQLEAELAELRETKTAIVTSQQVASERAATSGAAGFLGLSQKTMEVAQAQRSEGALSRQVMTSRMLEVAATQRSEGTLARNVMTTRLLDVSATQRSEGTLSRSIMSSKMTEVANAQRSEGTMARAALARVQSETASVRATIAAKSFDPKITAVVNTTVNVSLQEWQRVAVSSIRANSNSGGFI